MKITLLLFAVASIVGILSARDIPNPKNPSLEYEIINPSQIKPNKPLIEDNGQQSKNKTFWYDPTIQKWTEFKPSDAGEPKEGVLLWNQNNDKWLTQSFTP